MKRVLIEILALIISLWIVGCVSISSEEMNTTEPTEKTVEEILTEEKWQEVAFDNGVIMRFEADGSGSFVSNVFSIGFKWSVDGAEITMTSTRPDGEEETGVFTIIEENGMFILDSNEGEVKYSQVSDYEKAVEIYKTEEIKEVAYYKEYTTLPTVDSCVDVFPSGSITISEIAAIYSYYRADEEDLGKYINYLTNNGFFTKEIEKGKYEIIENGTQYSRANISLDDDIIEVYISLDESPHEINPNLIIEPAPIAISIRELKDNSAGTPELYLQFTNESDRDLVAFDFYVRCYDAYGEIVKGYNRYDVFSGIYDERLKAGTTSPKSYYYSLFGFDLAKKVEVAICRYMIDGEDAVDIPDDQLAWVPMK